MLRRAVQAVVVAALVAVPFAVATPQASADGIRVDVPGLLHVCIQVDSVC